MSYIIKVSSDILILCVQVIFTASIDKSYKIKQVRKYNAMYVTLTISKSTINIKYSINLKMPCKSESSI